MEIMDQGSKFLCNSEDRDNLIPFRNIYLIFVAAGDIKNLYDVINIKRHVGTTLLITQT